MNQKPKTIKTTITWCDPEDRLPIINKPVFFILHEDYNNLKNEIFVGKLVKSENSPDLLFNPIHFLDAVFFPNKIKYWAYLPEFE